MRLQIGTTLCWSQAQVNGRVVSGGAFGVKLGEWGWRGRFYLSYLGNRTGMAMSAPALIPCTIKVQVPLQMSALPREHSQMPV